MRFALVFLLLVAGCGYRFTGGQLPGDVQRLNIPLAQNRTAEPGLENVLAIPVTAVLARQKGIDIVEDQELSDASLRGIITQYGAEPQSYDATDRISALQATLEVEFRLIHNPDGRLLWQGTFVRQETYSAAVDKNRQEDLEAIAIESMARNIADDLLARLVIDF